MTSLNITPNLLKPDDTYAMLLAAHEGLTKDQSDALNARLILILCNHVGDHGVIAAALALSATDQSQAFSSDKASSKSINAETLSRPNRDSRSA